MNTLTPLLLFPGLAMAADAAPIEHPRLRAAALEFAITPESGGPTAGKTGAVVQKVAGPLKTSVTLLEDGALRVCLIATHMNSPKAANVTLIIALAIFGWIAITELVDVFSR